MRGKLALLLAVLLLAGGCREKEPRPPREAEATARPDDRIEMETVEPKTNPPTEPKEPAPLAAAQATEELAPLIEEELLRLINEERGGNGLALLRDEGTLRFAARIRAEEALTSLSHTRPDETPYHTAFREAGFPYIGKWHGENLAVLIVTTQGREPEDIAAALFRQYIDSPGHHSNILSEHFADTGIGVCRLEDNNTVRYGAAQMFASAAAA